MLQFPPDINLDLNQKQYSNGTISSRYSFRFKSKNNTLMLQLPPDIHLDQNQKKNNTIMLQFPPNIHLDLIRKTILLCCSFLPISI